MVTGVSGTASNGQRELTPAGTRIPTQRPDRGTSLLAMDGASLVRIRWRLRGAWMWPVFVVLTLLDGAVVHWHPLVDDTESPVSGWLLGCFLSLAGIVVLAPGLGLLLRRVRRDMPKIVARDYAGTAVVALVSAGLFAGGLAHRASIAADQRALEDAVARAEAYIGTYAPREFRVNLESAATYVILSGRLYRTCVSNVNGTRSYCVVVNRKLPFGRSVSFAGHEPNTILSAGTG